MSVSGFLAGEGRGDDRLVAGSTNRLRDLFDVQGQSRGWTTALVPTSRTGRWPGMSRLECAG